MESFRGKKLLVLAGAEVHCKVVRKAQKLGIYTIVTDYLPYEESPAKQIADAYWDIDIMDTDRIIEQCKIEKIDGVIAFCIDPAQIPYCKVCEALDLPCYGTRHQFDVMTNKRLFKQFCLECGLDTIPSYSEIDLKEDKVKFPIFIKPSESRGSRGQAICWNKVDAEKAIRIAKNESVDGLCLIEEYMGDKKDFSLACIVIDSVPYITKMGDRYLGLEKNGLSRQQICTLLPSLFADTFANKVEFKIRNLVKQLGMRFGSIFLQGFIDGDTVRFYDPGLRFPGSDYDVALEKATGFSTVETMIRFAMTGDITSCVGNPKNCYKLCGKTAMILSIAAESGEIASIDGIDEVMADERVVAYYANHKVGDNISKTSDIRQRIIEFVVLLDSRDEVQEITKFIYSRINIKDKNNMDMVVSKMGVDIDF